MLRLLCVTAHPDDEAGAFGGTLLLYHDRGVETSVLCLTAGTAARNRGTARTNQELATMRRGEFRASCKMLGVTHAEVLDYPDGRLDRSDFHAVTGDLVRHTRQLRPHVMLTFGMDGGLTGHPDHAMAGVLATMAFQWARRADRYPEQIEAGLRPHRAQKLYHLATRFTKADFPTIAPPTVTAQLEVGEERFQKKIEAFMQHTTQAPLFDRFKKNIRNREPVEVFHLVGTAEPREAKPENDLFEGVVDD